MQDSRFWQTFVISQSIGLTMFLTFVLFSYFIRHTLRWVLVSLLGGALAGVTVALLAALLMNDIQLNVVGNIILENRRSIMLNLFLALFFGSIILYFFLSRERQFQSNQTIREAQIKNLDHKKQIAETQLQLLQAQIEPHFLFNSLSNVISLIDEDAPRAKQMLESLTLYLRSSLSRSQEKNGRLQDELDLIENYLKILQIRMGERLQYRIRVDKKLLSQPFPIMLLQPVVENAIRHGLEPLAEGGCVELDIKQRDNMLHIQVRDNGVGLKQGDLKGFGLMNVRQRLQSLYGEAGRLYLEDNRPRGVIVTIELPYE